MVRLKRELAIFAVLFLFLSLAMHFGAWIDHPLEHLSSLEKSPLGMWHPLFITLLVYFVVLLIRLTIRLLRKLFG